MCEFLRMRVLFAAVLLLLAPSMCLAQSSPGLSYGQVPTPGQWNSYFAAKQDVLGYVPINPTGGTMTGELFTAPSIAARSGLNIGVGVAPTTPSSGDLWATSSGLYFNINGTTLGPLDITSVSNSDGTLTVFPTSGAVVASLALGHANTWTGTQSFENAVADNLNITGPTTGYVGSFGSSQTFTGSPGNVVLNPNTFNCTDGALNLTSVYNYVSCLTINHYSNSSSFVGANIALNINSILSQPTGNPGGGYFVPLATNAQANVGDNGTITTLASSATSGQTYVVVASAGYIAVNDNVEILLNTGYYQWDVVSSVSGTTINLVNPLLAAASSGNTFVDAHGVLQGAILQGTVGTATSSAQGIYASYGGTFSSYSYTSSMYPSSMFIRASVTLENDPPLQKAGIYDAMLIASAGYPSTSSNYGFLISDILGQYPLSSTSTGMFFGDLRASTGGTPVYQSMANLIDAHLVSFSGNVLSWYGSNGAMSITGSGSANLAYETLIAPYTEIIFDDTHATVTTGGLQRVTGGGDGTYHWQVNTASAGDFSSLTDAFKILTSGAMVVEQALEITGSSTGLTTIASANASATNYTLTLPAISDTLVTLTATQTLTNKSIAGSEINSGTVALANGGTAAALTASNGGIVYSTASALALLAGTGTANQCLLSGSSAAPSWGSCGSGTGVVASVSNSDGTLTISPTSGAVVASLALGHTNTWTGAQTFNNTLTQSGGSAYLSQASIGGSGALPSLFNVGASNQFQINSSGVVVAGAWPTLVFNGSCLRLENYGAGPTASGSANLAAWNAAVTALGTSNGCITIGPGTYTFSGDLNITLASHQRFTLKGAGKDVTVLNWTAGGGGINMARNFQAHFEFRDFTETTATTNGGNALTISDAGTCAGADGINLIENIAIRGADGIGLTDYWTNGVVDVDVNLLNITNLEVFGDSTASHGMGVASSGSAANSCLAVVQNISGSFFGDLEYGFYYGTWMQGVTITSSNFSTDAYGVYVPSSDADLGLLSITASQFNTNSNAIEVDGNINDVQIIGNTFYDPPSGAAVNVSAAGSSYGGWYIAGNSIHPVPGSNSTFGLYLNGNGSGNLAGVVSGNQFDAIGGTLTTAIQLASSSGSWQVYGNAFAGSITNTIVNSGTGNFVGVSCSAGSHSSTYGITTGC